MGAGDLGQLGIAGRCLGPGMAEYDLDLPQIDTQFEQVRRITMSLMPSSA